MAAGDPSHPSSHPFDVFEEPIGGWSWKKKLEVAMKLGIHDDLHSLPNEDPSKAQVKWLEARLKETSAELAGLVEQVRKTGPYKQHMKRAVVEMSEFEVKGARDDILEVALRGSVHIAPSGSGWVWNVERKGRGDGGKVVLDVVTCAHCVRGGLGGMVPVVDVDGLCGMGKCVRFDDVCDLALVRVVLPSTSLVEALKVSSRDDGGVGEGILVCGNPYDWDLEVYRPRKSGYKPFHVSFGVVEAVSPGDIEGDVEIAAEVGFGVGTELGGCIGSAWTYWGHSGSPYISYKTGEVLATHNSWNPDTADRHGVSLPAMQQFLEAEDGE